MKSIRRLILVTAVLAGCDSPTDLERRLGQLEFSTDRTEYLAGDSLRLRLVNRSPVEITYNLCGSVLHILGNGDWTEVEPLHGGICAAVGIRLLPGETAEAPGQLPSTLSAGTYRLMTSVYIEGAERVSDLPSRIFAIDQPRP